MSMKYHSVSVFVDRVDRRTRSGELVPIMTFVDRNRERAISEALEHAAFQSLRYPLTWIGESDSHLIAAF